MEGDYVNSISGKSSLFRVNVDPGSKVYRYDINIVQAFPAGFRKREVFMTKQTDFHTRNADALSCRKIIGVAHAKTGGFGSGHTDHEYVYDGKGILYSKHVLTVDKVKLTAAEVNKESLDVSIHKEATIHLSITPNAQSFILNYSTFKESLMDFETYTSDHSVRTFLELVTNEYLISTGNYQHTQGGSLFHTQPARTDHHMKKAPGTQIYEGIKKGVRVVDEGNAWLILDMLRSTFYASDDRQGNTVSLVEAYRQFVRGDRDEVGRRRFENHFKGVRMVVAYDTSRTVQFYSMSRQPISSPIFNVNGVSIPDFYMNTYDIELKRADLPGVQTSYSATQNNIVYPLEVLYVLPGQIIPQDKTLPEYENSVRAAERYDYITKQVRLLSSGHGEIFLKKFGVSVQALSNDVTIHCRALPDVRVGDGVITPPANGFFLKEMRRAKFLHAPNRLHNWVVCFDERIPQVKIEDFVQYMLCTLKNLGVALRPPQAICPVVLDRLEEVFKESIRDNKNDFIFFIDDKDNDSHGRLKLYEAKYKVLTQHVTLQTLELTKTTMQGIAMKLNSKCYGLNFLPIFKDYMHDLDLEKNPDLLVIGYDVAHPTPASPKELTALKQKGYKSVSSFHPSVVGIGANKNEHLATFSADFFYQESCREELNPDRLQKAICEIIECSFYSGRRAGFERKPTRLVIVRDGISEGQYKMAMERELQSIYKGYEQGMMSVGEEELAAKGPKITFVIATKRHSKRFFRVDDNGHVHNTQPGDVVNEGVVRKDVVDETFFQTHNAIKGTAQLTQYTVLLNDMNIPMLKIQEFMLMLSFMHQVSACPTSLPLPVYLADETAKRGQQIYNEWNKQNQRRNRQTGGGDADQLTGDLSKRFDELTEMLHYGHSSLVDTRYNS